MLDRPDHQPDPWQLARAVVEHRLDTRKEWLDFLLGRSPDATDAEGDDWFQLLNALAARDPRTTAGYAAESDRLAELLETDSSPDHDTLYGLLDVAAGGGFLVGVELGRRLGGVR